MMRDGLVSRSAELLQRSIRALPVPQGSEGFATEVFIAGLSPDSLDPVQVRTMEKLAKKVEVARKLCRGYAGELGKPLEIAPIAPEYVEVLAAAFLHHGLSREDWKWINTVLKLDWGILTTPEFRLPEGLAKLLDDLLGEHR
ncbi:hypothetical protein [uncultured Bosea sp.]|uniref:hypothetical protein n=1 Tax=uncultured Bosea sp. TaxID=211457 RepID=UPI0025E6AF1B|nr:hypothetical protein [uncultured Bosea sp.]